MHPVLSSRHRFLTYLAAWIPVAAMVAGLAVLYAGLTWPQALALATPLMLVYAFICLAAYYPCQAAPVGRHTLSRVLGVQAVAAAFSLLLWLFLASTWVALLEQVPALAPLGERYPRVVPVLLAAAASLWGLSAAIHYLFITASTASRAERQALSLEVLAREAELRARARRSTPTSCSTVSTRSRRWLPATVPVPARCAWRSPTCCATACTSAARRGSRSNASWRSPTVTSRSSRCASASAYASIAGSIRPEHSGRCRR
jgi:hypothetical protein